MACCSCWWQCIFCWGRDEWRRCEKGGVASAFSFQKWLNRVGRRLLEAVVGVDAESQDGGDFYWLAVAHGRLKFPATEGGENFRRHGGRTRFENVRILHISGSVESAGNEHAGVRQTLRKVGTHGDRGVERSTKGMVGGRFIGKLHDHSSDGSIDVRGISLTVQKVLVGLKDSSRTCCSNDGYAERIRVRLKRGAARRGRIGAVWV